MLTSSVQDGASARAADARGGQDSASTPRGATSGAPDFGDAVRFAWLGATGPGLLSAQAYVDNLVRVAVARS